MNTAKALALVILLSVTTSANATPPVHLWSISGSGAAYDLVFDASGNEYVVSAETVRDSVVTGEGSMTIAKYDLNGVFLSSRVMTGNATDGSLDVDGAGNIVVTARVNGPIDLGSGPVNGGKRLMIARFDLVGNVWTHFIAGVEAGQVAFDTDGNVIVAATFRGTVDFGGGALTSPDFLDEDIAVVKYDAAGTFLWNKHVVGVNQQWCYDVAVDQADNIVLTGSMFGPADFGGGMLADDKGDVFVAKYGPDGAHAWSKNFGGLYANAIAVDPAGNIGMLGDFVGTINLGGSNLIATTGESMFIAKFDPAGQHIWSRAGGTTFGLQRIALDENGNTVIAGAFFNHGDFGGGPISSHGNSDFFLFGYGPAGQYQWGKTYWIEDDYAGDVSAIDIDADGDVVITGNSNGIDFGGGAVGPLFVAKFATEDPTPVFITRFIAMPIGARVSLSWQLWADEDIEAITLYRSGPSSPEIAIANPELSARSYVDDEVTAGGTYSYTLLVRTTGGDELRSQTQTVTLPGLSESLGQNRPNPFNPSTTIEFTLSSRTRAVVNIYDIAGRLVTTLDSGVQEAGNHQTKWDGRDLDGRPVASGIYFYQLVATARSETRKMVLLK